MAISEAELIEIRQRFAKLEQSVSDLDPLNSEFKLDTETEMDMDDESAQSYLIDRVEACRA